MIEFWGLFQLASHNLWGSFIKVNSLQKIQISQIKANDFFRKELAKETWVKSKDQRQLYINALIWTMNQVGRIGPNKNSANSEALLKSVRAGEGALCADMAILYENVLSALGLPSRKVWLYRDFFERYDIHVTVEVLLQNKWVIMDPTFGVSFMNSVGELLSAQELKGYFLTGHTQEVKPVSWGSVAYPARLENYYLNYWPLYNNVFISERKTNFFSRIPPFCFWLGTKFYYQTLPFESDSPIDFMRQLYFGFALLIPILLGFYTMMIIFSLKRAIGKRLNVIKRWWIKN